MFAPREEERAKPTSVDRDTSPHHHETSFHEHSHEKQGKSLKQLVMEKEAEIKGLKDDLAKANFMIAFMQQENRQLKVNQMLMSKPGMGVEDEPGKGKKVIGLEQMEDTEVQVKPRRPRTKGMKRKGDQMSEPSTPLEQQDINKSIEEDFEKNREYWLDKVNCHLEKLLKRANRATNLQRHMARHYYTRNRVFQIQQNKGGQV